MELTPREATANEVRVYFSPGYPIVFKIQTKTGDCWVQKNCNNPTEVIEYIRLLAEAAVERDREALRSVITKAKAEQEDAERRLRDRL